MKARALTGITEKELDRRQFLKAAGAATVLGVAGVLGGGLLSGCAPAKTPKIEAPAGYRSLRMVGASLGGRSTTAAMVLASVLNKYYPEIEWSSSSGVAGTSPIYVTKGILKLAGFTPGNFVDAYGLEKVPGSWLRSIIFPTNVGHYVFLIPEDKPWKDITQVPKGLTLSPGTPGTTIPIACEVWLQLTGLSKKDFNWIPLGRPELADAWRAGKLDIAFTTAGGVEPFLIDLHSGPRKFKIMGMTPEQAAKAKAERTFERIGFEPPTMSNLSEEAPELFKYDVICPVQTNMLSCRDDFPEDIAYRMAKIIDERRAELVQMFAQMKYANPQWHIKWAKPPLDIHSGVAKYYREKGYLK